MVLSAKNQAPRTKNVFFMKDTDISQITQEVTLLAKKAKEAAHELALLDSGGKNETLLKIAEVIAASSEKILKANSLDLAAAAKAGIGQALLDRLSLNEARIAGMAEGLRQIAKLPDPTGEVIREWTAENGLKIKQVRVPLGVIGMIYEARPNVTAEAAGLCLKAGNAVILRGGSEAFNSNKVLVELIGKAIAESPVRAGAVQLLPPQDRRSITVLSRLNGFVDLIVARGSEEMVKEVTANATVPVLGHGKGLCAIYIDKSADLESAVKIAYNAKVQRPGVCNAMETLLVHQDVMFEVVPKIAELYTQAGVEIRGDGHITGLVPQAKFATDEDWETEFHDLVVAMKVVKNVEEAIAHIHRYGSGHTDSIITDDKKTAELFLKSVDSSCVMVNASTRLHDGAVFGFGSEIGISTNKLHARGTMGLRELTTTKFIVEGQGQIRE